MRRWLLLAHLALAATLPLRAAPAGRAAPALLAPVPPPQATSLAPVRDQGYAVLPPGAKVDPALEAALLADFPKWVEAGRPGGGLVELPVASGDAMAPSPLDPDGRLREFVARLTLELRQLLPEEDFVLSQVQVRAIVDEMPGGNKPHIDGKYLTATYSLFGPGTVIYRPDRGSVHQHQVPERRLAVISNFEREAALGRPVGTIHSAPRVAVDKRMMLLVRYERRVPIRERPADGTLRTALVHLALGIP